MNPPSSGLPDDDAIIRTDTVVGVETYGTESTGGTSGKTDVAKEQAGQVASGAADAGKHVAGVAKDEAANVASEAKSQVKQVASETKYQARDLINQAGSQVREQASSQQKKAATGVRTISEHLQGLASGNVPESGIALDLVNQASTRLQGVADWLDQREPGDLLQEVKDFAARRPGTFIAAAAIAGILAGRLTRGVVGAVQDEKEEEALTSDQAGTTTYTPIDSYTTTTPVSDAYTGTGGTGGTGTTTGGVYGENEYGTGLGGSATGDVRP
ncbi:hypothetical protein [Naasia sp. SYSU D00057]|uniref:hypothetical protein n=1 Tax=Naasia sp. SYSU D00057 TaxID=2817380 RepID=UPI001B307A6C|nr:hypothetical protein [Naasia sp. SYSU D00057]